MRLMVTRFFLSALLVTSACIGFTSVSAQVGLLSHSDQSSTDAASHPISHVRSTDEKFARLFKTGAIRLKPGRPIPELPTDQPSNLETGQAIVALPDFASIRQEVPLASFLDIESRLRAELNAVRGPQRSELTGKLASLYLAHAFYAEASTILQNEAATSSVSRENALLMKVAMFGLGRYRDIIDETHHDSVPEEALYAMALAKLGHYTDAIKFFKQDIDKNYLPDEFYTEYYFLHAESALAKNTLTLVGDLLLFLSQQDLSETEQARRIYLTEKKTLASLQKAGALDDERAIENLSKLQFLPAPYQQLAALDMLIVSMHAGQVSLDEARTRLSELRLQWRGGAFERQAAFQDAEFARTANDLTTAFQGYRSVINNYPNTPYANQSDEALQRLLQALFAPGEHTPLLQATQLFYENIDLLKPGAEGDAQIRHITQRLASLDLLEEAAELLEHQVFNRLRGQERASVAVELASLYLDDGKPLEALRVIRSTRITGLVDNVRDTRRTIEVTALWKSGQHDKALARLDLAGTQSLPLKTITLKGDIQFDMGDYVSAANTLYPVIHTILQKGGTLEEEDNALILKTLASLVLSSDQRRTKLLHDKAAAIVKGHAIADIISALAPGGTPEAFLPAYQEWLREKRQGSGSSDI